MARTTNAELQAALDRLAEENLLLRAEQAAAAEALAEQNAALREELEAARALAAARAADRVATSAASRRRSPWWTVLSVGLIVIGLVLAPVSVASAWVKTQLTDTDAFVATFAPLADDPDVQAFVADEVVTAIEAQVDIDGIAASLFDGIDELGLSPRAAGALQLLRAPAVAGVRSLITGVVDDFVASDAFSAVWTQALTLSHDQMIATLEGDDDAAISIGAGGEIAVELGPIVAQVQGVLVDRGLTLAANIPSIDRTIVIATSDRAGTVQTVYGLAVAAGIWLPWVALAFLVAGVVVARRRIVALLGASIGLAVVMIALGSGLGIGRILFVAAVSPGIIPRDAAIAMYSQVITFLAATTLAVTVLAVTVAVVGWLSSGYRPAVWLRSVFTGWTAGVRAAADRRGVTTGRFGQWLYRQRVVVRVVVGVIGAAVVLFVRPLSPGVIVWTAVIAIVLLGLAELLQRPVIVVPAEAEEDTPVVVG